MNLSRIKNLVKQNGDKVILVENDEPEVVVMSFAEYEKLTSQETPHISGYRAEGHDQTYALRVEEAGFHETEFIRPSAVAVSDVVIRPEEIRLEDLPI